MIDEVNMFPQLICDLLSSGRSVRFRAPGRSMYPTIREGETLTVAPILPKDVRKGDILLYRLERSVIAHRVTRVERIEGDTFRFILRDETWGYCNDPVDAQQILGKVTAVEREGRSVNLYTGRVKMRRVAHALASHIKRLMRRAFF